MKKINTLSFGNQVLTRKEQRLLRKTIQKVKSIYSSVEMDRYEKNVAAMPDGRPKLIILLATASTKIIKAKLGLERGEWQLLAQSRNMREAIFVKGTYYLHSKELNCNPNIILLSYPARIASI